jgi:hypothetical protein
VDIKFDPGAAKRRRLPKCGQRVFGKIAAGTTVANDDHELSLQR